MNIRQAIKQVDDATTFSMVYAPGYSAHLSTAPGDGFTTPDRYCVAFVQGMMPPHSTEMFNTADQVASYLEANNWADGWEIEEDDDATQE